MDEPNDVRTSREFWGFTAEGLARLLAGPKAAEAEVAEYTAYRPGACKETLGWTM